MNWENAKIYSEYKSTVKIKRKIIEVNIFHRIGPLGRFDLVVAKSVCQFVPFHVLDFEAYFAPTSRSGMSKLFRDSEYLGKSAGKKWSQN